LRFVAKPYIIDKSGQSLDVKFDVIHALGGGYLFRSPLLTLPESAPSPLKFFAIYTASSSV
jgi:hypothetical protein